jgi:NADH:ubiquinone reductase (H+-translocating)
MQRPHIVILGAGFGGMYVAKKLVSLVKTGEIDLTIVNRTNYFLFTPLLHEVATGGLNAHSVAEPLREIFSGTGVQICQGEVEGINNAGRRITVSGATIHYDYLVVATGAETNYYNIPGAETYSFPLKSLADAEEIRSAVIEAFERAVYDTNPEERLKQLSFAVVGGGATGVEVAAELAQFIEGIVSRYYQDTNHCHREEPAVSLIHAGKELLEMFPPSLRKAAADRLAHKKVVIHTEAVVTEVNEHGLVLSSNCTIPAATIIWAAGVKPVVPQFEDWTPVLVNGRLPVDDYFMVKSCDRIFALGDVAAYLDQTNGNKPLPLLAQVAVGQARTVAKNIRAALAEKPLQSFTYRSKGSLVSVGQLFAIGDVFNIHISGMFTWWLWRMTYLFKFGSHKKRVRIIIEWVLNIFYPRDITVK